MARKYRNLLDDWYDGLDDLEQAYRIAGYEAGRRRASRGVRAPLWLIVLAAGVFILAVLPNTSVRLPSFASGPRNRPSGQATPAPASGFAPRDDRDRWCVDLMAALGNTAPDGPTVAYCVAWQNAEDADVSGAMARHNPLNTSQDMPGASIINDHGVKGYTSRADGLAATAKTIGYDFPGYGDIRAGLLGNDPERALKGLAASPWGTNAANVRSIYTEILPKYR